MSSQDIQRGVTSRQIRVSGKAPTLENALRLREFGNAHPDRKRMRRKSTRPRSASAKLPLRWIILLGVITLAAFAVPFGIWISKHQENFADDSTRASEFPEVEYVVRVPSRFPSPSQEDATQMVEKALANRDPAEVSTYFRSTFRPDEVIDFLEQTETRDGKIEGTEWHSSLDTEQILLEGVVVNFKRENATTQRFAFLTPDESGVWKVDFDAYARCSKPGWSDLLKKESPGGMIRVVISQKAYYNGAFANDNEWVSYKLLSPDAPVDLIGYCKVGTPLADSLAELFVDKIDLHRVTLEICRVSGSEVCQFEITRILSTDWVVPDGNALETRTNLPFPSSKGG